MNTKSKSLRYGLKQLCLKMSSPLTAVVAVSCAFLVETGQVDVTYPLKLVLKGFIKDPISFQTCSEGFITDPYYPNH